jgi:hypothetical protein
MNSFMGTNAKKVLILSFLLGCSSGPQATSLRGWECREMEEFNLFSHYVGDVSRQWRECREQRGTPYLQEGVAHFLNTDGDIVHTVYSSIVYDDTRERYISLKEGILRYFTDNGRLFLEENYKILYRDGSSPRSIVTRRRSWRENGELQTDYTYNEEGIIAEKKIYDEEGILTEQKFYDEEGNTIQR